MFIYCCSVPGIQCPDPGVPLNGRRIGNDFSAGLLTVFACNNGFQIQGEQILACLDIGVWSNDTPTCVQNDSKTVDTCQ